MTLPCSHPPIYHPGNYIEQPSCVHHVPRYLRYYSSYHQCAKLSRAVCGQYKLNQPNPSPNPNLTEKPSHPVLRPELNALSLCVPVSNFTYKATNSEVNNRTSVYYIESYYKTYYKTKTFKQ
jgi:hypothetical protein